MAREVVQKQAFEHRFASMMKQYGNTIRELDKLMGTDERFMQALRSGRLPSEDKKG